MKQNLLWVIAIFVVFAAAWHFGNPNIADPDSFFYMGLASWHRESGVLANDFPWIYHSVVRELSASLWYGFGVFLIPFSLLSIPFWSIKIAGVLLTAAALFSIYWVCKKFGFRWPAFWPFLAFFAAPNSLFHFLMVRPQTISLILAPLLFYFLLRRSFWGIALTSFGIVWFHFNFAWLPVLIFAVIKFYSLLFEKKIVLKEGLTLLAGLLLGWLLRPEPIAAAKLFYIQVFQQIFEKSGGLPLIFGAENYPLSAEILFTNFLVFLVLWVAGTFFISKTAMEKRMLIFCGLTISSIFFLISIIVARRAYDFWIIFGVIFLAAVFSFIEGRQVRQAVAYVLGGILVFLILFSGVKTGISLANQGHSPTNLKEVSLWLKENSQPGEIVFNLHWADFSPLFYWNRQNYYTFGLDPIFAYAYNPSLYWKFHYLSIDQVTKKTCGAEACTREQLEDTYEVLVRDFNAKYVLLTKDENPAVDFWISGDDRFQKVFETDNEKIYLIQE
ncbi:MAG: hypothetical protein HYT03_00520 [Candidatus Harrisonbacteria bacterium]|nr:hypothetical protein [Candidatus Harrisonbacteria bacterium]